MTTRNPSPELVAQPRSPLLPTVSYAFVEDWLVALQAHCTPEQLRRFLSEIDLQLDSPALARVAHDQIVRLYQLVALETGDEMMGLWSRCSADLR